MDDFTRRYLLCESTRLTDAQSALSKLAFVPGPRLVHEPLLMKDVEQTVAHSLQDMFATFAALPRAEQSDAQTIRWAVDDRWIELTFHGKGVEWKKSPIQCSCTFADVAWMWLCVCRKHRAVMLTNSHGRLFTVRSFLHELAFRQLSAAFGSLDATVSTRASEEMKVYRLVARDVLR